MEIQSIIKQTNNIAITKPGK